MGQMNYLFKKLQMHLCHTITTKQISGFTVYLFNLITNNLYHEKQEFIFGIATYCGNNRLYVIFYRL